MNGVMNCGQVPLPKGRPQQEGEQLQLCDMRDSKEEFWAFSVIF